MNDHEGKQQRKTLSLPFQGSQLPSLFIFSFLLAPRLLAAQYSLISDCDEGARFFFLDSSLQFTTIGNLLISWFTVMAFRLGNILQYMPYEAGPTWLFTVLLSNCWISSD